MKYNDNDKENEMTHGSQYTNLSLIEIAFQLVGLMVQVVVEECR